MWIIPLDEYTDPPTKQYLFFHRLKFLVVDAQVNEDGAAVRGVQREIRVQAYGKENSQAYDTTQSRADILPEHHSATL